MREFFVQLASVILATGLAVIVRWVHDRLMPLRPAYLSTYPTTGAFPPPPTYAYR